MAELQLFENTESEGAKNKYIYYIAKSIGSPPSNERFHYLISMSTNLDV